MLDTFNILIEPEGEELVRVSATFHGATFSKIMTPYRLDTTPKCFLVEELYRGAIHKAVEAAKYAN